MVWMVNQQVGRGRSRIWGVALLCWLFIMLVTPKIPLSYRNHLYADMRNFVGVPNTLNVITNFPFLIVGVLGLPGELWGWLLFYGGTASVAFGSAYYHLRPDDNRVLLDTLPMMIAYSSLFSTFILERLGERIGLSCLFSLVVLAVLSTSYARTFNDLRLCMIFQLIPCIAIPIMTFLFPPKYTHSRYWLWTVGVFILAKMEALADMKIYRANNYIISGHSLEHLCSAIAPVLVTVMLMHRSCRFPRYSNFKVQNGNS
ncbi:hypothetical protein Golax_025541 [Gossypium laxum]|uniref:Alkaline phytoceramidase n=1 Tax=Gossypium laxum TaxID=34288 RepID=A0A7J9B3P2_9ROSI|nr:hypothetical protein [Gossypium laxum]